MPSLFRSPLSLIATILTATFCVAIIIFSVNAIKEETVTSTRTDQASQTESTAQSFPLSVNPITKKIEENPLVDWYVTQHLSIDTKKFRQRRFIDRVVSELVQLSLYQQLASPLSRTLVIYPGERREEVVKHFGDILRWSNTEREEFSNLITSSEPAISDGKFYPGKYTLPKNSTPEQVASLLINKFAEEILARYDESIEEIVPLKDTLVIASLLEREAYNFDDMRYISGIIWNRLFIDMPLQLDATLQYAKGNNPNETKWWPKVRPVDKYIDSPFNTYEEKGLPPSPIANPSLEAVVAALNPRATDCLFYFHDSDGNFYCSINYEGHVALLKEIYGQGR